MAEAYTNIPGQRLDVPDPSVALSGSTMGGSPFRIVGTTLQVLIFQLQRGNKIYTERGAMSWMTDGVSMNPNMGGGLGGLFKRAFAGESLFIVDYEPQKDGTATWNGQTFASREDAETARWRHVMTQARDFYKDLDRTYGNKIRGPNKDTLH